MADSMLVWFFVLIFVIFFEWSVWSVYIYLYLCLLNHGSTVVMGRRQQSLIRGREKTKTTEKHIASFTENRARNAGHIFLFHGMFCCDPGTTKIVNQEVTGDDSSSIFFFAVPGHHACRHPGSGSYCTSCCFLVCKKQSCGRCVIFFAFSAKQWKKYFMAHEAATSVMYKFNSCDITRRVAIGQQQQNLFCSKFCSIIFVYFLNRALADLAWPENRLQNRPGLLWGFLLVSQHLVLQWGAKWVSPTAVLPVCIGRLHPGDVELQWWLVTVYEHQNRLFRGYPNIRSILARGKTAIVKFLIRFLSLSLSLCVALSLPNIMKQWPERSWHFNSSQFGSSRLCVPTRFPAPSGLSMERAMLVGKISASPGLQIRSTKCRWVASPWWQRGEGSHPTWTWTTGAWRRTIPNTLTLTEAGGELLTSKPRLVPPSSPPPRSPSRESKRSE